VHEALSKALTARWPFSAMEQLCCGKGSAQLCWCATGGVWKGDYVPLCLCSRLCAE